MTRSQASFGRIVFGAAALAVLWSATGPSAQTIQFTRLGSIAGPADLVEVHQGHAYIAADKTLTIVNLANPAAPKRLGSYTFPEKIWGFRIVGSLVYVAADFFGLGIVDVSNPAAPVLRGSLKLPGQAKNVAVVGTRAAVADHMSGVDHIDVSNPAKPVSLGSFFLDGYARDVAASGSFAYAVDSPTGVYVFDLSKPGTVVDAVTTQQTATAPGSIVVAEADAAGPRVAILVGGGSIQIYDLSKAQEPVRAATFRTPSGRPRRATLSGSVVYVADGDEGIQLVDVTNPAKPAPLGGFKTDKQARDVAVADSMVLVVVGLPGEGPREVKDQEVLILRRNQ
jgi:hypothetical protein